MELRFAALAVHLCLAAAATALGANLSLRQAADKKVAEILVVWDVSANVNKTLARLKSDAHEMFSHLAGKFPKGAKFGLATFSDKPVPPFGFATAGDHCYRTVMALTADGNAVDEAIQTLESAGGGDAKDSQLDALYFATSKSAVGWSDGERDAQGNDIVRIVILATGSLYHTPLEGRRKGSLPAFEDHGEDQCGNYASPTAATLHNAYDRLNAHTVFLVPRRLQNKYRSVRNRVSKRLVRSNGSTYRGGVVELLQPRAANLVGAVDSAIDTLVSRLAELTPSASPPAPSVPSLSAPSAGQSHAAGAATPRPASTESGAAPAEVLIIWDMSEDFKNDTAKLKEVAGTLLSKVADAIPGDVKFALATFNDKPISPFGSPSDHCYRTEVALTTNHTKLVEKIETLESAGGGDAKGSQLDALYFGAKSASVGWSRENYGADGKPIVRIVVLATNSMYHTPEDAESQGLTDFIDEGEEKCGEHNYPGNHTIHHLYDTMNIHTVFLAAGWETRLRYRDLKRAISKIMVARGGMRFIAGVDRTLLQTDSANLLHAAESAIKDLVHSVSLGTPRPPPPLHRQAGGR